MTAPIDTAEDSAIDKVAKLIPAEIVAALTAINGLVPEDAPAWLMPSFAIALLVLVYFYLTKLRGMKSHGQVAFVCLLAFPVWASNILTSRFDFLVVYSYVFASLLIFVSLMPPLIFPRAPASQ